MPKIYRGMKQDQGQPALGPTATTLGARVPEDIDADANGLVHPGIGGMSVAPSLFALPAHRVPQRLRFLYPNARALDTLYVWSMGSGEFVDGPLTQQLYLRLDPQNAEHGLVEPTLSMDLAGYQSALAATQSLWTIDEK